MVSVEKIVFYLILALGIIVFLKLDRRMPILNRLFIAIVAVLVLLFLFLFISAVAAIVLVIVLIGFVLYFLERGRNRIFAGRKR